MYLFVFVSGSSCSLMQNGLMPQAQKNHKDYPLTAGKDSAPTLRIESFHMAVAHLRCFNAALTDKEKGILFDWYNRDQKYISGAKKDGVAPYTDLYWTMFFNIVKHMVPLKKLILKSSRSYVYECSCMYQCVFIEYSLVLTCI